MAKRNERMAAEEETARILKVRADIILIGQKLDPETGAELISGFGAQQSFERCVVTRPIGVRPMRCRSLRGYIS